ncbi:MAG: hypothetical protein IKW51_08435 [Bacteroidales bacterium]|nr:hypothetical protein [Bacteroidales bacterium]
MSKNEKKVIARDNWMSNFALIGVAKINDYTFKIDEKSEKSSWIYNSMNLGIDCGEKFGTVYAEMMGGYSSEQPSAIYAHGKNDDGSDDFESKVTVDWNDRFDEDILDTIGDLSFITVGLEKTDKKKTFYKKFLSSYDAIAYIKAHLEDGMVVNVRGNLKYSMYQDKVQVRKNITSIVLSSVDDASKYIARFTQTILIDKASANLKNIDKDKSVMYVDARVLDYMKEYNGKEVKGQFPFNKQFEFEMDFSNEAQCKKIMEKVFKVKKGITQITFEGDLIEGGAVVTATLDDIPQDIKDLIDCGVYTEEEALVRCSSNGNREQRMVLRKPMVRLVGEDKTPTLQRFEEKYSEDDLVLDYLYEEETVTEAAEEGETESTDTGDGLDWLNSL